MINNLHESQIHAPDPQEEAKTPVKAKKVLKGKKAKKPWTKKRIITWAAVALVVLLLGYSCVAAPVIAASAARSQVPMNLGTTVLAPREISTSISATGIVESADKHYVYPTAAAYTVMEVPVEVGDAVQEGDILCLLDDSALRDQIDSSELSLTQSEKSANQQVKTARDSYNAMINSVQDGTNSTLISAQSAVTSAYNAYLNAVDSYDQYASKLDDADAAVQTAKSNWKAAKEEAKEAHDKVEEEKQKTGGDPLLVGDAAATQDLSGMVAAAASPSLQELEQLAAAADAKVTAMQTALATAEATRDSISAQGSSLSRAVDTAYNSYQTALRSMDAAIASVETQIQSSKNQLDSTKIGAETADKTKDLTLEQLEGSLDDTIVRAPASGTVTAVYATVGSPGSGLLFVIEDVNRLVVKTSVKAFDVAAVKTGLPVTIKSDATGEDIYDGALTFIAPATQKTALGETNTANEVFDAEVAVTSKDTGLRIGMSARLSYIVDKQTDVLAVPYDAVYTNAAGQSCVLAAVDNGKGKYVLTEMPVTLGIESDLDVAISGEGIVAGLRILNEPEGRLPGEVITLV